MPKAICDHVRTGQIRVLEGMLKPFAGTSDATAALIEHCKDKVGFVARYNFGSLVASQGSFWPPTDPGTCKGCRVLADAVGDVLPLSLVLKNRVEVFHEDPARPTIPLNLLGEGEWFGVFELLGEPGGSWSVAAGTRSAHLLLPFGSKRIEEATGAWPQDDRYVVLYRRRRAKQSKFKLDDDPWWVFRAWARDGLVADWHVELLVLPQSAVAEAKPFVREMYRIGWEQSAPYRTLDFDDPRSGLNLESAVSARPYQVQPIVAANLRHLVAIGRGVRPGFAPAIEDDASGPWRQFATAMVSEAHSWYPHVKASIGRYDVIFMRPVLLGSDGHIAYYSFCIETLPFLISRPSGGKTHAALVNEIFLAHKQLKTDLVIEFLSHGGGQWASESGELPDDDLVQNPRIYRKTGFLTACARITAHRHT